MKQLFKLFIVYGFLLVPFLLFSQDIPDPMFKIPVPGNNFMEDHYSGSLLQHNADYKNPNTKTRIVQNDGQYFAIPPNIRPFPSSVTQSEVDAANMKGNDQVIYATWNNLTPSIGVGFCYSSDGGATWTGNSQSVFPAQGDPGPWIWPSGTPWAGRLGVSFINGAGYSTNQGTNWTFATSFVSMNFDKNFSAVDDVTGSPFFGRAYTVWTVVSPNSIMISFSSDGGITWSTPSQVSPPSATRLIGCDIESGPGGVVYVVWANLKPSFPMIEDSLGFAKSTDGGVSWAVSVNNAVDLEGINQSTLFNGTRINGLPRIAVDNTGGPRNGWIYVCTGERNITPATDIADICLCRSTNGGADWTHTRINQDAPGTGRFQCLADIDVVPDGSVVCSYYDQRNTVGPVAEYWMSRSTDGCNTWVDLAVSDHSFTPVSIVGNYQGDYTGITTAANKIWPFWADNSSGIYQIWTAGISYEIPITGQQVRLCRTGLNKIIPDPPSSGVFDTIMVNITGAFNVIDVNVKIDTLIHPFDSDLRLTLQHGSQSSVIIDRVGGRGGNFISTYINDSVPNSIALGISPFSGKFKPSEPLSSLNNTAVNGPWILHVQDLLSGNTGILKQWCIIVSYQTLLGNIETVEIPGYYTLNQNYPNPFNPVTTIQFGMPRSAFAKLVIFDILGQEVETLVNEDLKAGTFKAEWNASNYPSGIYFYKLETNEFSETKKMVLVK